MRDIITTMNLTQRVTEMTLSLPVRSVCAHASLQYTAIAISTGKLPSAVKQTWMVLGRPLQLLQFTPASPPAVCQYKKKLL